MWEISVWPTESNNVPNDDDLVDLDRLVDGLLKSQQDKEE